MDPDLAVVVSPNGLGHARRVVGVLHHLLRRRPGLRASVVLEAWQVDRFADWPIAVDVFAAVDVVTGVVEPGPRWSTDPRLYDDGRLSRWWRRLADVPSVARARLAVSDNLVQTLAIRPDAVLMGSFLLSDVLAAAHAGNAEVDAFVTHERALLAEQRPAMLCVGAMAMPGVLERTAAVPLPWMFDEDGPHGPTQQSTAHRPRPVVAVLGGRTGAADDLLAGAGDGLRAAGLDVRQATDGPASEFDHSPAAFAEVDIVVCRPGLGTVHDAIRARTPLVAAYEPGNVELVHNARRIAQLGFGVDAGPDPAPAAVVAAVRGLLDGPGAATARRRMADAPGGGLEAAAAALDDRLA